MTVQSASTILRIADGVWATPLGRLMTPEGITKTFLFVASEGGSMVTVNSGAALQPYPKVFKIGIQPRLYFDP